MPQDKQDKTTNPHIIMAQSIYSHCHDVLGLRKSFKHTVQ